MSGQIPVKAIATIVIGAAVLIGGASVKIYEYFKNKFAENAEERKEFIQNVANIEANSRNFDDFNENMKHMITEHTKKLSIKHEKQLQQQKLNFEEMQLQREQYNNEMHAKQESDLILDVQLIGNGLKSFLRMYEQKKLQIKKAYNGQYFKQYKQWAEEKKRLTQFEQELSNLDILRLVLLGVTGHGKSSTCNRLCKDCSLDGDEGPFKTNDGIKSGTKEIKKVIVEDLFGERVCVVDTPGIFDSDGDEKDRFNANDLVQYLRGCGGVNAFIIVKTMTPLVIGQETQKMLGRLQEMLGEKFWDYVIFMVTGLEGKTVLRKWPKHVPEFKEEIKALFPAAANAKLPVIGISNVEDGNYKIAIEKLITKVSREKFECIQLKSPLDVLEAKLSFEKGIILELQTELKNIGMIARMGSQRIQDIYKNITENNPKYELEAVIMNNMKKAFNLNEPQIEFDPHLDRENANSSGKIVADIVSGHNSNANYNSSSTMDVNVDADDVKEAYPEVSGNVVSYDENIPGSYLNTNMNDGNNNNYNNPSIVDTNDCVEGFMEDGGAMIHVDDNVSS